MKESNLKKNFIYNVGYQILILIIPLITMPYISRVLGADGIGQYSFTYSIVYYFMIIAMLGFNNYGNRSIAKVRDNKKELSKTFKEIHLFQITTTFLMVVCYLVYILFICKDYKLISYIQFIYVVSCFFDINWFFFGIEKFKLTVIRNTIIKLVSLVLIFLLVKKPNDVWIYTSILAGSTFLSQIALWPFVKKYVDPTKVKLNIKKHVIPCLKLFLPVIAVAIYKIMDKTMLGIMTNTAEVGFYENAEKIISIPNAIIAAMGTVMLPRMSNMYSKGKDNESKKMISKSLKAVMSISLPMVAGLIAISHDFSVLFFGDEFIKTGELIILLSITCLFLSWGNVIRTQYLIPKEMDKEFIISAFLGAVVNFVMNIIFIPKYASVGACYGTIVAEFVVMFYQTYKVRKYLPIWDYLRSTIMFIIKSIIMFVIVYLIGKIHLNKPLLIVLQIGVGGIIYLILNYKYYFMELNFKQIIFKIFGKDDSHEKEN